MQQYNDIYNIYSSCTLYFWDWGLGLSNNFWAVPTRRKRGKDRKTSIETISAKLKQHCAT